jgi:hypothetical protein
MFGHTDSGGQEHILYTQYRSTYFSPLSKTRLNIHLLLLFSHFNFGLVGSNSDMLNTYKNMGLTQVTRAPSNMSKINI